MSQRVTTLDQLWQDSPAPGVSVRLGSQGMLALVLILVALMFSAMFSVLDKRSFGGIYKSVFSASVASIFFGFGTVCLMGAVGVYV